MVRPSKDRPLRSYPSKVKSMVLATELLAEADLKRLEIQVLAPWRRLNLGKKRPGSVV